MAKRKNYISIDMYQFADYADKLDKLGADLKKIIGETMEEAGEDIQKDVDNAMQRANLPAKGKYSRGTTAKSIIDHPKVKWSGSYGEMPLGFDKSKPGAGGWLITGTPKMQPDKKLAKIFQSKKYAEEISKKIRERLAKEIEKLGGKT